MKPLTPRAVSTALSPFDFNGGAAAIRTAATVAKITATEATAAIRVIHARITGRRAAEESTQKIRQAADAVEEFLGGRPDPKDVIINSKGDIVILKGNKKFRMDIKHPGLKRNDVGNMVQDEPHFHLQEFRDGEWKDAANTIHRNYFRTEK